LWSNHNTVWTRIRVSSKPGIWSGSWIGPAALVLWLGKHYCQDAAKGARLGSGQGNQLGSWINWIKAKAQFPKPSLQYRSPICFVLKIKNNLIYCDILSGSMWYTFSMGPFKHPTKPKTILPTLDTLFQSMW